MSLHRQLEMAAAEIQRLSGENDALRQQCAGVERTSSELLVAMRTLTAQYHESEALRSEQVAMVKLREQQLRTHAMQLQAMRQILDIVQDTRTYRLLRQIGRWRFLDASTVLSRAELAHMPLPEPDLADISPAEPTADVQQEAEFDPCYDQVRHPKKRGGMYYAPGAEGRIVSRLRRLGFEVCDYELDVADYRQYVTEARYVEDFPNYYPGNLAEKALEHYIAAKLLRLNDQDTYIDVASEHSPVHEIYRRLFGAKTYRQDLAYPPGLNGVMIGGDAANMPVPGGFASKMALHCSFEHFEGDTDSRFIREVARVLRPGGAVCIVPFYLSEEYAIQTDPVVALSSGVVFEDDATVYCAQGWNNRYGRFYDAEHLRARVGEHLHGLTLEIYALTNVSQVDETCYARFAMVIKKPEVP